MISEDSAMQDDHAYIPNLDIDQIKPNPYQPRIEIKPETLLELADSIREMGIIEPLIVTEKEKDSYELIAGERRWRAAKLAGLKKVPAVIKEASPQQMLELAIIENIQRADLNPLEEALAFKQLADDYNMTHTDIAKKVGLSRPAVANKIRLLQLPENIKKGLLEGTISEGHARALLGLPNDDSIDAVYRKVRQEDMSVRAVEELVRRISEEKSEKKRRDVPKLIVDKRTSTYERKLQEKFGDTVKIYRSRRGGKVVLPFQTDKEMQFIIDNLLDRKS